MIDSNVSLDLMQFIETSILPRYTEFGRSHGLAHVKRVIDNSLKLARITGANVNMVYAIAAYHDIGMSGPRAIHHITGGKIMALFTFDPKTSPVTVVKTITVKKK